MNAKIVKGLSHLMTISFERHLCINLLIRLILIVFSVIQDRTAEVPFTDVDYKVVTDGARHMLSNESPFRRHTYRYSPLLAFLMIPNLILHECWGKVLFNLADVLVSVLARKIVFNELRCSRNQSEKAGSSVNDEKWANIAAYMILYNPMGIVISSRGSNDAICNLLILGSIYFLLHPSSQLKNSMAAGVMHGLAIHFRIFPIIFSLAYYLVISTRRRGNIFQTVLLPNRKQITLTLSTVVTLFAITFGFYVLYGFEYLDEAYLYHLRRVDIRHNFSLHFLMQYLRWDAKQSFFSKLAVLLPRLIAIFYLSITFGRYRKTFMFCVFIQTLTFVTFNTVVTSQYFVWYLTLLTLCIPNFRFASNSFVVSSILLWTFTQVLWLLPAYLLEFKCWNTFNWIGFQSIAFFLANVYVILQCIQNVSEFTV